MATHLLWSLMHGIGSPYSRMPGSSAPVSPLGLAGCCSEPSTSDDGSGCSCSAALRSSRALHIEGLPATVSAAELSALMAPYGTVQYAEAAPEAFKKAEGEDYSYRLHCYVVFADHRGACQAKRVLQPWSPQQSMSAGALRVRFCRPHNLVPLCTPAFSAFITAQWAQSTAVASPDYKKTSCRVNALFISKLHQHITTARLSSLFGKFGKMLACEVQYHSDGRSAGHGVVIYETIEDAEKALMSANGYRLEGRTIEVTPLRLKKLPSKLEHLKNRIIRQPLSGDGSGSEDGSGSIPASSPKRMMAGPPPTAVAAAAAAAALGLSPQQQQAAAAVAMQHPGFLQGLQAQQQQYLLQQMQQQMALQQLGMLSSQLPMNSNIAAASAAAVAAAATNLVPITMGMQPASVASMQGMPGLSSAMSPAAMLTHGGGIQVMPLDGVVPPGLDLSFISQDA